MIRAVSYGGGVQSTALLVLAAQGRVDYPLFLFSNVGDESEHPDTLRYLEEVAKPFAAANNIELVELFPTKYGKRIDLYRETLGENRTIGIPVRMPGGAPGRRSCTMDYKIKVVYRELRRRGATREDPAVLGLGISMDEMQRMRDDTDPRFAARKIEYPLIDLRLRRYDCQRIITDAGLPPVPRSACWFCPFNGIERWRRLKREQPALFEKAVEMERQLQAKRQRLVDTGATGLLGQIWFNDRMAPLDQIVDDQLAFDLDGEGGCESGFCFT